MTKRRNSIENSKKISNLVERAMATKDPEIILHAKELIESSTGTFWNTNAEHLEKAIQNFDQKTANERTLKENEVCLNELLNSLVLKSDATENSYSKDDIGMVLHKVSIILKRASLLLDISPLYPLEGLTFTNKNADLQLVREIENSILKIENIYLFSGEFISLQKVEDGRVTYKDLENGMESVIDFTDFKKNAISLVQWIKQAKFMPLSLDSSTRLYRNDNGPLGELHIVEREKFKWIRFFSKSAVYNRSDLDVFKDKNYVIMLLVNQLQENLNKKFTKKKKTL